MLSYSTTLHALCCFVELGFSGTAREMLTFMLRNTSPKKHAVMNATPQVPRVEKCDLIIIEGDPVDCINIWILGAGQSEDTV